MGSQNHPGEDRPGFRVLVDQPVERLVALLGGLVEKTPVQVPAHDQIAGRVAIQHLQRGLLPLDLDTFPTSTADLPPLINIKAADLIGDLTVYENVELPLTYRGMPAAERKAAVTGALDSLIRHGSRKTCEIFRSTHP